MWFWEYIGYHRLSTGKNCVFIPRRMITHEGSNRNKAR